LDLYLSLTCNLTLAGKNHKFERQYVLYIDVAFIRKWFCSQLICSGKSLTL